MRRLLTAFAVTLAVAGPAKAGLYESGESYEFVPMDGKVVAQSVDKFRSRLSDLRGIAIDSPQPSKLRTEYLARRDELSAVRRRLSAGELNVLGAAHYRLHDTEAAISAWTEVTRLKDRSNFPAHSNLVLGEIVRGDYIEALKYFGAANSLKPGVIPGMTKQQTAWYFKVDMQLRAIVRNRAKERGIAQDQMRPDDLFGVEFVADEAGGYQAGQIAAAAWQKLPDDAIAMVQQLVYWLPFDARLEWLLAELYNAAGDPGTALALLNDCLQREFHPKLLREHRQVLQDHFDSLRESDEKLQQQQGQKRREMFWVVVLGSSVLVMSLVTWQLYLWKKRIARKR